MKRVLLNVLTFLIFMFFLLAVILAALHFTGLIDANGIFDTVKSFFDAPVVPEQIDNLITESN